jgi:ABC-type lipoprotein export system ATPase subunit
VTRTDIIEKIRRYMKSGIVIFITHDEEIAALADKTLEIGRPKGLDGVI